MRSLNHALYTILSSLEKGYIGLDIPFLWIPWRSSFSLEAIVFAYEHVHWMSPMPWSKEYSFQAYDYSNISLWDKLQDGITKSTCKVFEMPKHCFAYRDSKTIHPQWSHITFHWSDGHTTLLSSMLKYIPNFLEISGRQVKVHETSKIIF